MPALSGQSYASSKHHLTWKDFIWLFKLHVRWEEPSRLNRIFDAHFSLHDYSNPKALGINGKPSVAFMWSTRNDQRWHKELPLAWALWSHQRLPKGNCHFGHKSVVFLPSGIERELHQIGFFLLLFSLFPLRGKEISKRGNSLPSAKPNLKPHLLLKPKGWCLYRRGGVLTLSAPKSGKPKLKCRFKAYFRSVTANYPAGVKGTRCTRRWKVPSQASHHH